MNVKLDMKDGLVTLSFDPKAKPYKKTAGGNDLIAGHQGNLLVPGVGNIRIGLNVFTVNK